MLPAMTHRKLILCVIIFMGFSRPAVASQPEPRKLWDDLCPFEAEAYQMADDFGTALPHHECALQYYYYVPCPTYSWFWAYSGWTPGDMIGACFTVGEEGTGGFDICTELCYDVVGIRVLDFAGYGTVYPGLFTFEMDFYCGDYTAEPRVHLWNSRPLESHLGWNYFEIDPPVVLSCPGHEYGDMTNMVVTMTMIGVEGVYPAVGFDNVSTPAEAGCEMHDRGSMPAVYPRKPAGSMGTAVRSGYIGTYPFEHWPPLSFPDGKHAGDPAGPTWYGYAELAWRLCVFCDYPTETTGDGRQVGR